MKVYLTKIEAEACAWAAEGAYFDRTPEYCREMFDHDPEEVSRYSLAFAKNCGGIGKAGEYDIPEGVFEELVDDCERAIANYEEEKFWAPSWITKEDTRLYNGARRLKKKIEALSA